MCATVRVCARAWSVWLTGACTRIERVRSEGRGYMQEEKEYTIPEMVDEVRAGKMQRRQFMKRLTLMGISAAGIGAIAAAAARPFVAQRSEEHTSELQSRQYLVCRLLLEKKKKKKKKKKQL